MKVSRKPRGKKQDSEINIFHRERIENTGHPGTKRFVDPNKLYIGNLPFDATEDDMMAWIRKHLGTTADVYSVKVIRDWRWQRKSKGYGFIEFIDPIRATSAIMTLKNQHLKGRIVVLNQGRKKPEPKTYIVKRRSAPLLLTTEEGPVNGGLRDAAGIDNDYDDEDLLGGYTLDENADVDIDEIFDKDGNIFDDNSEYDEEMPYDGIFEEEYKLERSLSDDEKKLNRQQRREIAKKRGNRKLPEKGFAP
eukprot:CAMPEP_0118685862 /NCGR_PEP_ID=MMETSP0800-20121206/7488_1 /TAXON_ID=210618 ORGANISM="Striatella unipunctata, Strain CCMP2910" /NCGR_SAMPLE_ID=MMETSP0800 /ASSEMBLY_ACC=CAM_ASM_000638 /LENGTH=248 /DNA_ID=CAMNT_0006582833 /DNA_START=188 /DNA_END=934 /DNA_ORIENTATION=-